MVDIVRKALIRASLRLHAQLRAARAMLGFDDGVDGVWLRRRIERLRAELERLEARLKERDDAQES